MASTNAFLAMVKVSNGNAELNFRRAGANSIQLISDIPEVSKCISLNNKSCLRSKILLIVLLTE